jgi:uncharacterized membrane protein YesL
MKPNMGTFDRVLRISAAFIIAGLYFTKQIDGTVAYILLAVAAVLILTSFISVCPLYLPFGISTRKRVHLPK